MATSSLLFATLNLMHVAQNGTKVCQGGAASNWKETYNLADTFQLHFLGPYVWKEKVEE